MSESSNKSSWWSQLNGYQKMVFAVATMAWMFDCLDQQLFNLARTPAMNMLLKGTGKDSVTYGGYATSFFMIGWAVGGMIFGSLGDRYGRAKMLGLTVALYSVATGLSALSNSFETFCAYRVITGIGIGGVFGLAVALVADTVSNDVRPKALGILQSFSGVGNVMAGMIGLGVYYQNAGANHWKYLFLIGALPALLVGVIQMRLQEPQSWLDARAKNKSLGKKAGSYADLFGHATWRKHALLGMILSCAGVVGLWGIGVFSTDFVAKIAVHQNQSPQYWGAFNLIMFNVGAFFGMYAFTRVAVVLGRKKTFTIFFIGAMISTLLVYQTLRDVHQIIYLVPIMGFFQLSVFAGFSMYLPELFPMSLRSTGTSFCYNVGRFAAASAPFTLALIKSDLTKKAGADVAKQIDAFGNAASMLCVIFFIGIIVLPFLPETKGQPLPEE